MLLGILDDREGKVLWPCKHGDENEYDDVRKTEASTHVRLVFLQLRGTVNPQRGNIASYPTLSVSVSAEKKRSPNQIPGLLASIG
jgi:hypothetical protein